MFVLFIPPHPPTIDLGVVRKLPVDRDQTCFIFCLLQVKCSIIESPQSLAQLICYPTQLEPRTDTGARGRNCTRNPLLTREYRDGEEKK